MDYLYIALNRFLETFFLYLHKTGCRSLAVDREYYGCAEDLRPKLKRLELFDLDWHYVLFFPVL